MVNLSSLTVPVALSEQPTDGAHSRLSWGTSPASRELYLNDNQLTGPIPAELGDLSSLTRLYLNDNQLTGPIPAEFGYLFSLRELWLSDNQLTGPIPAEFGYLFSLTGAVALDDNQLTGPIPADVAATSPASGSCLSATTD